MDTDNNIGIGLGRGRSGAGWRWGKGEKVGRTVTTETIQKKKTKGEDGHQQAKERGLRMK